MNRKKNLKPLTMATLVCATSMAFPIHGAAQSMAEVTQQIEELQAQVKALKAQLDQQAVNAQQANQAAQQASAAANTAQMAATAAGKDAADAKITVSTFQRIPIPKQANSYTPGTVNMYTGESNPGVADSKNFLQRTRDDSLSFGMPSSGGITLYGQFDVSIDDTTNGIAKIAHGGAPGANNGWMPAISTNSTYVGLRGFQPISGWHDVQFLWQLQTNIALTAVGATAESNSAQSNTVSGSLTTGDSYIGLGSKDYGSAKIGKTFAPYFRSTSIFNPFQGMLGSMDVVMANTGGDNRVEFGTLLEHSLWYESPNWNGWSFGALFAPGQNRASDSSSIPAGGSNCNGGNVPGSGGLIGGGGSNLAGAAGSPDACNDGGFGNAFSTSVAYDDKKAWYLVAAYELHQNVNRGSDLYGASGVTLTQANALYSSDVGNETAGKIGVLYRFQSTGTTIGGIFESMRRSVPSDLEFLNERQRNGSWLLIQQSLPGANQLNFGWAHAGVAKGDAAGQHNYNPSDSNSSADMYTIALLHQTDRNLSFYANYAITVNAGNDHYDLGAGGHGIKTDCHSSSTGVPASGGLDSSPQCWAGSTLQGASVGMKYRF